MALLKGLIKLSVLRSLNERCYPSESLLMMMTPNYEAKSFTSFTQSLVKESYF